MHCFLDHLTEKIGDCEQSTFFQMENRNMQCCTLYQVMDTGQLHLSVLNLCHNVVKVYMAGLQVEASV